jgi:Septum formation
MAGTAHHGGRMTAPVTTGTGAEPDPGLSADHDWDEEPELPRRRVGALGIIAMIICGLAVASGLYVVLTHGFKQKTELTYHVAAVFSLRAGDCFNSAQNGLDATVQPCSSPHDAEVIATFPLAESSWPGIDAVQAQAQAGCAQQASEYANLDLNQESVYPDEVTWRAGVRTVICDLRSANGPITGSVLQTQSPVSQQSP